MMKIAFSVVAAATVLITTPLSTPTRAQGVDVQIGRDRGYDYDQRRRYEPGTTVGVGPGGVTVGQRQRCRTVTTTVERDDGRMIRRKERICD
jgi:hypothetical protein